MEKYITTANAAEIIGCVDSRVRQLLREGIIAGVRLGRDWLVDEKSARRYAKKDRRPGPKREAKP